VGAYTCQVRIFKGRFLVQDDNKVWLCAGCGTPDPPSNETKLPFHKQTRHPKNYKLVGNPLVALFKNNF